MASQIWRGRKWEEIRVCFARVVVRIRTEKKALRLKEEPKTAVKHLFEKRYLVAVLCNVRMPVILLLVKKSPGLKPGRAGLMFKVISLNWSVCPCWAINFWFSARYVKNCASNIFILTRVPTSVEIPQ